MNGHSQKYKRENSLKVYAFSFFSHIGREGIILRSLFTNRSSLLGYLLLGVSIRLLLAPFLGHPYDLRIFMAVGWAVANGITPYGQYVLQTIFSGMPHPHLYGSFYGIGYPPMWGLILGFFYRLYSVASLNNIYLYAFALKMPVIIGDIAAALILCRILRTEIGLDKVSDLFCFYMFCPFFLIVGAVWGMFDMSVFLFSIISAYLLFRRDAISAVSLAVASSLKPYSIVLAPLYAVLIFKKFGSTKRASRYLIIVLCLVSLLTVVPMFVFGWPLSNLYHALASHITTDSLLRETYGAASPFNIFNVLRLVNPEVKPPNFLSYIWIGGCLATYIYTFYRSSELDFRSIVQFSFLTSMVFFTTRFWVSEQNLVFLLSFFTLAVLMSKTRRGWMTIHALWILLLVFVLIHVPASAFLWMVQPWALNAATAFCDGPFGYLRWVLMSVLTFSWLGVMLWYSFKERIIP